MIIFPGSMDKLPVNDLQMTVKNLLNIAEQGILDAGCKWNN